MAATCWQTFLFEVSQERGHPFAGQIIERQARDFAGLLVIWG
jgi:hypothetical protein